MQVDEALIRSVVAQVLSEVGKIPPVSSGGRYVGRHGVFTCAKEAIAAASEAYEQLRECGLEDRKRIIDHIRRIATDGYVGVAQDLTVQERKILPLLAAGFTNKEIAAQLHIAVHTVKSHVHNILEKLALHTRLELASFVHEERLAEPTAPKPRATPGRPVHRRD